jgi:hypothetical protein
MRLFAVGGGCVVHFGMDLNQLFKVNLHRRGRLNLPDNIRMVYLWMHSGGFNPPLRWII